MEHLKKIDYFLNMSNSQLRIILKYTRIKHYNKNQIIYHEHDDSVSCFFFIIQGEFVKFKPIRNENLNVIELNPPDIFGDYEFFHSESRQFSVKCTSLQGTLLQIFFPEIIDFITINKSMEEWKHFVEKRHSLYTFYLNKKLEVASL